MTIDLGNIGNWNLFGNQAPLGERPIPETYDVHGLKLTDPPDGELQDDEHSAWRDAVADWEEKKSLAATREATYQKMAQNVGDTPPAFTTRMPKREAPEFVAAGRGPVDILAPEVETIDDLYRKRPNMFRMI